MNHTERLAYIARQDRHLTRNLVRDAVELYLETLAEDGAWRMPHINAEFVSRKEIRAAIERLQGFWNYFVQNPHPGTIQIEGDSAVGRAYISELGQMRDGSSHLNYAMYHDRYQRTPNAGSSLSASTRSSTSTPLRWRGQRPHAAAAPAHPPTANRRICEG